MCCSGLEKDRENPSRNGPMMAEAMNGACSLAEKWGGDAY